MKLTNYEITKLWNYKIVILRNQYLWNYQIMELKICETTISLDYKIEKLWDY